MTSQDGMDWFFDHGLRIVGIVVALALVYIVFRVFFPRLLGRLLSHPAVDVDFRRRVETLASAANWLVAALLFIIGLLTILPELGVNIAAVLTGLGITGVALALGAQLLVRDVINGVFILLEDQFRKGDYIAVGNLQGVVEDLSLRRTVLRDWSGVLHVVPNSLIGAVSNYTRGSGGIFLEVRVAYGEDLERVRRIVDGVGQALARDPAWGHHIIEAPRLAWVEAVGDQGIVLRVRGMARPGCQWELSGVLRQRLVEAFLREGVRVPFPSHVLAQDQGSNR
ncbi:MAG: mechanosensitive ion channel family protein [Dehalococcoidia bacterium]|nr:mechanosensitive ion channel family protein [Dehalococcoidia bacterium]MDW8009473.1 mechanosensitive ion channel family protein [Chloroflexota bacterium]HXG41639.1 mechanosensitive ion channel family protein [Dehalococcoidia bacterium]